MQVKKQQLELDMEKWTGSKLGKEYVKAVYCHPAYLTSMHSTSSEVQFITQLLTTQVTLSTVVDLMYILSKNMVKFHFIYYCKD